jgi:hypothetical protein
MQYIFRQSPTSQLHGKTELSHPFVFASTKPNQAPVQRPKQCFSLVQSYSIVLKLPIVFPYWLHRYFITRQIVIYFALKFTINTYLRKYDCIIQNFLSEAPCQAIELACVRPQTIKDSTAHIFSQQAQKRISVDLYCWSKEHLKI